MLPTFSGSKGKDQDQATLRLSDCPRVEPLEVSPLVTGVLAHALWREGGSAFRQSLSLLLCDLYINAYAICSQLHTTRFLFLGLFHLRGIKLF
jgi:hypothetical protein